MPNFRRIITNAYVRILERPPDTGGLEGYNQAMNQGLTEAAMRESLLRSQEYANNNPSLAASRRRPATRARRAPARKAARRKR
jgi:hypothetical protein